jgi:hypothetical protein
VADEDVERFVAVGATASMQPCHLATDRAIAAKALGARTRLLFRCRTLRDRGVPLLLGTDAPVEPPDPLVALHFATARRHPDRPDDAPFHPEEALSEDVALALMTRGGAAEIGLPDALPPFVPEGPPQVAFRSNGGIPRRLGRSRGVRTLAATIFDAEKFLGPPSDRRTTRSPIPVLSDVGRRQVLEVRR